MALINQWLKKPGRRRNSYFSVRRRPRKRCRIQISAPRCSGQQQPHLITRTLRGKESTQTSSIKVNFTSWLCAQTVSEGVLGWTFRERLRRLRQRPVTEPRDRVCCIAVAGRYLPQLLAVLPRNSLVLGFHINSFHSFFSPSFAILS